MPLGDSSADVVISNCVINLSGDKPRTIAEAARFLKPGEGTAISDVIVDPDMDDAAKADRRPDRPTHHVHEHAPSAIIRARKPA